MNHCNQQNRFLARPLSSHNGTMHLRLQADKGETFSMRLMSFALPYSRFSEILAGA